MLLLICMKPSQPTGEAECKVPMPPVYAHDYDCIYTDALHRVALR